MFYGCFIVVLLSFYGKRGWKGDPKGDQGGRTEEINKKQDEQTVSCN